MISVKPWFCTCKFHMYACMYVYIHICIHEDVVQKSTHVCMYRSIYIHICIHEDVQKSTICTGNIVYRKHT